MKIRDTTTAAKRALMAMVAMMGMPSLGAHVPPANRPNAPSSKKGQQFPAGMRVKLGYSMPGKLGGHGKFNQRQARKRTRQLGSRVRHAGKQSRKKNSRASRRA
jgi:hypothetical protein